MCKHTHIQTLTPKKVRTAPFTQPTNRQTNGQPTDRPTQTGHYHRINLKNQQNKIVIKIFSQSKDINFLSFFQPVEIKIYLCGGVKCLCVLVDVLVCVCVYLLWLRVWECNKLIYKHTDKLIHTCMYVCM